LKEIYNASSWYVKSNIALEAAYHRADKAIQQIVDLLAA